MMSDDNGEPKYKVGYGKPPAEYRFRKGQSGNLNGRPRRARTKLGGHAMDGFWQKAWNEQANKLVTVTINGRRVRRRMGQLALERAFADAAAGKPTALRIVTQKLGEVERLLRERWEQDIERMGELHSRKTVELEARRAGGENDPVVLPHPDDIVFNHETGSVDIVGPADIEQHKAAMLLVRSCLPLVDVLDSDLFVRADDTLRAKVVKELAQLNSLLPPRLQQWPGPQFPEDYELFPEACVKKWVLDGTDFTHRDGSS
jgi:hypothetical protein